MNSQATVKAKRQKKKKSRTEVVSSDSESDNHESGDGLVTNSRKAKDASLTEAEVSAAFTKIYMQRATVEFAEDLDKIRGADDFKDDALEILIESLKQGTGAFKAEEKRRVVTSAVDATRDQGQD